MTTREEVRKAIIANTSDGYSGMRGGVDGAVNALMSLPALRLAEKAEGMSVLEAVMRLLELVEQNKDWKLAVVDSSDRPMIDPVVPVTSDDQFYDNDYRKVVAQ
ncbi:MAG: hypothetical protein WC565_09470 [Parcubacteria group bacterium]